jgi:hypothetical protein
MLALSLANSGEAADKETAIGIYRSLAGAEAAEPSDAGNLATLLIDGGNYEEAKSVVFEGIKRFPAKANYLSEIGQRIVEAKGDKDFREQMRAAIAERGKRD